MKCDMNLIRQIAFQIESATGPISSQQISIGDFSPQEIAHHCEMMNDRGLIVAHSTKTMRDPHPMFCISRLSPLGHDFVNAARNDTVWNKVVRTVKNRLGDLSIQLLIDYLKKAS
jgi:hypothetical protein